MSLRPEPNENLAHNPSITPEEWPKLLASAALVIQTLVKDPDEYLREAIRQHEKRLAQLGEKKNQHKEKKNQHKEKMERHKEKMDRHEEKMDRHEEKMERHEEKIDRHRKKIQHSEIEDPYIKKEVDQYKKEFDQYEKEVDQYRKEVDQYRKEADQHRKEARQYCEGVSQYQKEVEYGIQLRNQAESRGLPFEDLYPSLIASGYPCPPGTQSSRPVRAPNTKKRPNENTLCDLLRGLLQKLYQLLLTARRWLLGRPPSALPGNHKVRAPQQLFSASATPKPPLEQAPAPIQAACLAAGA